MHAACATAAGIAAPRSRSSTSAAPTRNRTAPPARQRCPRLPSLCSRDPAATASPDRAVVLRRDEPFRSAARPASRCSGTRTARRRSCRKPPARLGRIPPADVGKLVRRTRTRSSRRHAAAARQGHSLPPACSRGGGRAAASALSGTGRCGARWCSRPHGERVYSASDSGRTCSLSDGHRRRTASRARQGVQSADQNW